MKMLMIALVSTMVLSTNVYAFSFSEMKKNFLMKDGSSICTKASSEEQASQEIQLQIKCTHNSVDEDGVLIAVTETATTIYKDKTVETTTRVKFIQTTSQE